MINKDILQVIRNAGIRPELSAKIERVLEAAIEVVIEAVHPNEVEAMRDLFNAQVQVAVIEKVDRMIADGENTLKAACKTYLH